MTTISNNAAAKNRQGPSRPIPKEAFDWYDEYAHGMIDRRVFLRR